MSKYFNVAKHQGSHMKEGSLKCGMGKRNTLFRFKLDVSMNS